MRDAIVRFGMSVSGYVFDFAQIASASLAYGKRRPDAFLQLVAPNRQQTSL